MGKKRFGIQAAATLLQNANWKGFFTGAVYTGSTKQVCVPGLNCYSCPGAVGACPLGTLQNQLSGLKFRFPYYVLGLLIFFGALLGRAVCGFLCPFGWLQELLNLIPFPKRNAFRADRPLRKLKYVVLALLVIVLPLCVRLTPFFCKYVCPGGTLAGMALALRNPLIARQLGPLFSWKALLLGVTVLASLIVWRPFCKYLCPLGAIYGLFNRVSLIRLRLDSDSCIRCHACKSACRMNLDPVRELNHAECIRCGDCVSACPAGALRLGLERPAAAGDAAETQPDIQK